ncbi:hypothetical protein QYE76_025567 [Lolium multiflorum]|uniref:F-box domain-containing protein n=1 Tax=Lolium multiflorum TaxID=4521 RepID=A0AAD8RFT7_LOLMU|nr:hypothetical protein QYE76_025567 [Lolium multiflorum]
MATRRKKKHQSSTADRITALPLDLRARIVSYLSFCEVVQLSALSRSWRHIHHHVPVVDLNLGEFVAFKKHIINVKLAIPGIVDDHRLLGIRVALALRARDGIGSKVETLRLAYSAGDPRVKRHADRLISLTDAPKICLDVSFAAVDRLPKRLNWKVDLPPAARHLKIRSLDFRMPTSTIAGPGAAALRKLYLHEVTLREWPRLPSLRSLRMSMVTVTTAFTPGATCPMLEQLAFWDSTIKHPCVDIRLPHLKSLDMDDVRIELPSAGDFLFPYGDVTVDAPELEELMVICSTGCSVEYKSFTLRAPAMRYLQWFGQFAELVHIDVGKPGSVTRGTIQFTSNGELEEMSYREMKDYRAQMMQMLHGLLPHLPPLTVADTAQPYITSKTRTVMDEDLKEMIPEETLTCDLGRLMARDV